MNGSFSRIRSKRLPLINRNRRIFLSLHVFASLRVTDTESDPQDHSGASRSVFHTRRFHQFVHHLVLARAESRVLKGICTALKLRQPLVEVGHDLHICTRGYEPPTGILVILGGRFRL